VTRLMKMYEFSLNFELPEADADPVQLLDALYETGCGDAKAGVGKPGRLALQFSREGASAGEALRSAIQNVLEACPELNSSKQGRTPTSLQISKVAARM